MVFFFKKNKIFEKWIFFNFKNQFLKKKLGKKILSLYNNFNFLFTKPIPYKIIEIIQSKLLKKKKEKGKKKKDWEINAHLTENPSKAVVIFGDLIGPLIIFPLKKPFWPLKNLNIDC